MATRTAFAISNDNSGTSYPDDGPSAQWDRVAGSPASQAEGRYQRIGLENRTISFPSINDVGFNTPTIRFMFLNAYGERISGAPSVYLKLPTNFNVTGLSDYSRTEGVFAGGRDVYSAIAGGALGDKTASYLSSIKDTVSSVPVVGQAQADALDALAKAGITGAEAIGYSLKRGLGSVLGFIGSAGLSNLGQYEFNERQAVNPMAQLLYKGPQVRRYQFPFAMNPKSSSDSKNIRDIINVFRVASSTSVPDTSGVSIGGTIAIGQGNSFTFGYPHLTQFTLSFLTPESTTKKIFRSKVCVIESVSVDYGGQKMTFFEDGRPTDVNLTLQLSEVMPRTLGDAYTEALDPNISMN